jgi:uncharacterized protein YxjI
MKDDWLIKILLGIIFGLFVWSANREIAKLDKSVTVLHQRINMSEKLKADKEDAIREHGQLWREIYRLRGGQ